jgi:hypothetical protein
MAEVTIDGLNGRTFFGCIEDLSRNYVSSKENQVGLFRVSEETVRQAVVSVGNVRICSNQDVDLDFIGESSYLDATRIWSVLPRFFTTQAQKCARRIESELRMETSDRRFSKDLGRIRESS